MSIFNSKLLVYQRDPEGKILVIAISRWKTVLATLKGSATTATGHFFLCFGGKSASSSKLQTT